MKSFLTLCCLAALTLSAHAGPIHTSIVPTGGTVPTITVGAGRLLKIYDFVHDGADASSASLTKNSQTAKILESIAAGSVEFHRTFNVSGAATVTISVRQAEMPPSPTNWSTTPIECECYFAVGAWSRFAIDKRAIVRQTGRRVFSSLRRLFVATLAIAAFSRLAAAEDLKTTSGRVYKDATILRADGRALMIQHRFGVVRVPFSEIAASSRQSFNAQKAGEIARSRQTEERHRLAAQRASHTDAGSARLERIDFQRTSVELAEREEAIAEGEGKRIRRGESIHHPTDRRTQRHRLKGEVIGVGPDWILVLCETDDTALSRGGSWRVCLTALLRRQSRQFRKSWPSRRLAVVQRRGECRPGGGRERESIRLADAHGRAATPDVTDCFGR